MGTIGVPMTAQQVKQSGRVGWDLFYNRLGRASNSSNIVMEISSYLTLVDYRCTMHVALTF